jgi:hypothetical protein
LLTLVRGALQYSSVGERMPNSDQLVSQSHLELEKRIRARAHKLWQARTNGHPSSDEHSELQDWLQAERELLGSNPKDSAQNRGATVGNAGTPDITFTEQSDD